MTAGRHRTRVVGEDSSESFEVKQSCFELDGVMLSKPRAKAAERLRIGQKRCRTCKQTKPIDAFNQDSSNLDGRRNQCRECQQISQRGKEKERWARKTPEEQEQERIRKRERDRMRNWRQMRITNPLAYMSRLMRRRIQNALKSAGARKCDRTLLLIGCSAHELSKHIESQFKDGMTWENYGIAWHVDHVIPCASFNLRREDHQRACFHYTNLQPLGAKPNISKSSWHNGHHYRFKDKREFPW